MLLVSKKNCFEKPIDYKLFALKDLDLIKLNSTNSFKSHNNKIRSI